MIRNFIYIFSKDFLFLSLFLSVSQPSLSFSLSISIWFQQELHKDSHYNVNGPFSCPGPSMLYNVVRLLLSTITLTITITTTITKTATTITITLRLKLCWIRVDKQKSSQIVLNGYKNRERDRDGSIIR